MQLENVQILELLLQTGYGPVLSDGKLWKRNCFHLTRQSQVKCDNHLHIVTVQVYTENNSFHNFPYKNEFSSVEHVVNYNEINPRLHEDNASNSMQTTEEEPKFLDTINPLLSFSKADLAAMDQEYDQFFDESDSSSDDNEPVDLGELNSLIVDLFLLSE